MLSASAKKEKGGKVAFKARNEAKVSRPSSNSSQKNKKGKEKCSKYVKKEVRTTEEDKYVCLSEDEDDDDDGDDDKEYVVEKIIEHQVVKEVSDILLSGGADPIER